MLLYAVSCGVFACNPAGEMLLCKAAGVNMAAGFWINTGVQPIAPPIHVHLYRGVGWNASPFSYCTPFRSQPTAIISIHTQRERETGGGETKGERDKIQCL